MPKPTTPPVGPILPGGGGQGFHAGNMIGRMIVGAIGSELGGGKYENGALTAAMEYLFNEVGRTLMNRRGYTGSPADPRDDGKCGTPVCEEFTNMSRKELNSGVDGIGKVAAVGAAACVAFMPCVAAGGAALMELCGFRR